MTKQVPGWDHAASAQRKLALVWDAKLMGCIKCGETHPGVLDFHHRDPTQKLFSISRWNAYSEAKLVIELAKCDVLCANCHRKLHWEEQH